MELSRIDGGITIRWRRRPKPPPPFEVPGTGITDLAAHIYGQAGGLHPALRRSAGWVMDDWWLGWVQRWAGQAAYKRGQEGSGADVMNLTLLGLEVLIRPDGGWPHLEPVTRLQYRTRQPRP
jgi:hypothetical protein